MDPTPSPPDLEPTADNPEPPPPKGRQRRRNGFVAKKPYAVREKINVMILDGIPYAKIIDNLGPDGENLNEQTSANGPQEAGTTIGMPISCAPMPFAPHAKPVSVS